MKSIIKLENVSFTYENSSTRAVNNVTMEISAGEKIAIVGSNGSGKSSLIRLLNGLLEAESGKIIIDNLVVNENNLGVIRQKIGMVFQNPDNQFVGSTVENDVAFGLENRGINYQEMHSKVEHMLSEVSMLSFRKKEPDKLSGGQKQRVAIASVLALEPQILILDEATSMLDPEGRRDIQKLIQKLYKEKQMTILSVTHDLDEIMFADRVLVMQQGSIKTISTPQELFQRNDLVDLGLDLPFTKQLKQELSFNGVVVDEEYQTESELIEWLKLSNLQM